LEIARGRFDFDAGEEGSGFGVSVGSVADMGVAEGFIEASVSGVKVGVGETEVGFAEDGGGLGAVGGGSGEVGGLNGLRLPVLSVRREDTRGGDKHAFLPEPSTPVQDDS
jgi:hypothetical protein